MFFVAFKNLVLPTTVSQGAGQRCGVLTEPGVVPEKNLKKQL
jgi:hypothetical protein